MIVDSQTIMRDGLQALLSSEANYEVVGTMSDGGSAIDSIGSLEPDIILMDLSLAGISGVKAIARIKRRHPKIRIVALTFHKEDKYIYAALEAGADAYLLKDDSRSELFAAMSSVLEGKIYLSPGICDRVVPQRVVCRNVECPRRKDLSEPGYLRPRCRRLPGWRKRRIRASAVGNPDPTGTRSHQIDCRRIQDQGEEIATHLSLSPKTVETHRTNLMQKLDLHSVSEVTVYAIQNGIIAR